MGTRKAVVMATARALSVVASVYGLKAPLAEVHFAFPDAHLMLVADELVIGQPTVGEELVAQGNVRLRFVKP